MPTIIVECPNAHRFPINTDKHQNRDYRICPQCRSIVRKEGLIHKDWQPNRKWPEERQQKIVARVAEQQEKMTRHFDAWEMLRNPLIELQRAYLRMSEEKEKREEKLKRIRQKATK